jgi:transposase
MRSIARSLGVGYGSVHEVVQRAVAAELRWPLPVELDDAALEHVIYRGNQGRPRHRSEPDWTVFDTELRSRKGVTLQLLWLEYKQVHPDDGLQYAQFCVHYRQWQRTQDVVLRQPYRAGEKMFVDYAGQPLPILNPRTGELWPAALFIAALGASSMIFAEVHEAQTLPYWIGGHTHAVEYFEGAAVTVPDNPKTGGAPRLLVRARTEPHVCRVGCTLRHRYPARPSPPPGQSNRGSQRAAGGALDPRRPSPSHLDERGQRRMRRSRPCGKR